jgi:phosphate:Na+ symporter
MKNIKLIIAFFLICVLTVTISGCKNNNPNKTVDKIIIIYGNNQCVPPNTTCKKELKLELLGPNIPGMFGGKGSRNPVSGIPVKFVPLNGTDLSFEPKTAISKSGGGVSVKITSGNKVGDQYFKVIPENSTKTKTIRVISGISVTGVNQEARTGHKLANPISLKVVDNKGTPVKGAKVYFNVSSSPEKKSIKATCTPSYTQTNKEGIASTKVKIGNTTGIYKINAEVNSPEMDLDFRGIQIPAIGIDVITLVITVLGGLAIFIFGMKLMTEGLQLVAGQKMKGILRFLTKNRFIAVLAGAIITGAIQSSSACTVMVVGFVNAGLLTLTQSIGIVFGANIGTTITAQMISFKLGAFALPAIIIGSVIIMLSKHTVIKGWGQTIFGFGFLFFGMGIMGNELKLLSKFPSFIEFFSHFNCVPVSGYMPVGAVLGAIGIGAAMTVLIQSSSATIGIALALAMGGLINFYTAVPLILGDNIGTTITALLASIGTNERARQTALAHMLFNVLGTIYMVLLFFVPYPGTDIPIFLYFINAITAGDVFAVIPENIARHIAMAHTLFNVINVIIFLPFIAVIAKICNIIIKVKDEDSIKIQYLEPHLLDTPSLALEQVVSSLRYMLNEAWDMICSVRNEVVHLGKTDEKFYNKIMKREAKIDEMQTDITDYLVQLTGKQLTVSQAEIIPLLMHCTNDSERIGDHADIMFNLVKRLNSSGKKLSEDAVLELKHVWKLLCFQAQHILLYLENPVEENAKAALKKGKKLVNFSHNFEKNHIKRLNKGKCEVRSGIVYIELLTEFDRISNHLTNIAERMPEIQKHYSNLIVQK